MPKRSLFRQVNEQIRAVNGTLGAAAGPYAVLCECGLPDCAYRVTVPGAVYDDVRASPARFLVSPGHERSGERVVAEAPSYRIVEAAALTAA